LIQKFGLRISRDFLTLVKVDQFNLVEIEETCQIAMLEGMFDGNRYG